MGIVISVVMGVALTLPISSAALSIILGLSGLPAGAATVGCSAQMIGFAVASFRENKWDGLLAQGIGTSMLQISNIVKNPLIWIPPTWTSAILGPLATVVFQMENNPAGGGMGTSGLVGQIMTWQTMAGSRSAGPVSYTHLFTSKAQHVRHVLRDCAEGLGERISFQRLIYLFLETQTKEEEVAFDKIEKEILELEQALITSQKKNFVSEIIHLRKRLMLMKRYYEQFLNLLDVVTENENNIFDGKTLRSFKMLSRRMERSYQNVLNLREAVTQIREMWIRDRQKYFQY